MAKFATVVADAVEVLTNNAEQAIVIEGAPGNGKTAAGYEIAKGLEVPPEAIVMFRPATKDAPDLSGLPDLSSDHTKFLPPDFIWRLNAAAQAYGKAMLYIDEIGQSTTQMFNGLAGVLLDNEVGGHHLDKRVFKVATTNRTTDKAGVTRMPTHVANRLIHFEMQSDLDGWCDWALMNGLPVWLIAFLRFKPGLLNDFSPDRKVNPTERTWHLLAKAVTDATPDDRFMRISVGTVGEGAAAELSAFKQVMTKLPSIDDILMDPKDHPVPTEPAIQYALMGALAHNATKDNFGHMSQFLFRCPPEFQVLSVKDAIKLNPEIKQTQSFIKWAVANKSVFL